MTTVNHLNITQNINNMYFFVAFTFYMKCLRISVSHPLNVVNISGTYDCVALLACSHDPTSPDHFVGGLR